MAEEALQLPTIKELCDEFNEKFSPQEHPDLYGENGFPNEENVLAFFNDRLLTPEVIDLAEKDGFSACIQFDPRLRVPTTELCVTVKMRPSHPLYDETLNPHFIESQIYFAQLSRQNQAKTKSEPAKWLYCRCTRHRRWVEDFSHKMTPCNIWELLGKRLALNIEAEILRASEAIAEIDKGVKGMKGTENAINFARAARDLATKGYIFKTKAPGANYAEQIINDEELRSRVVAHLADYNSSQKPTKVQIGGFRDGV